MSGSSESRKGGSLPIADVGAVPEVLELGADSLVSVTTMLEALPVSAAVLDSERRIVAANARMLREFGPASLPSATGRRIGQLLGCVRVEDGQAVCGTSAACAWCGTQRALTDLKHRNEQVTAESRMALQSDRGGALEIEVRAAPLDVGGRKLTIVTLRDISAEKRRRVLERIFFHDVLNTAGGICGIANVLAETDDPEPQREFKSMLLALSEQLVEEINSQRQLMAAETGELQVSPGALSVADLLRSVVASWSKAQVAMDRSIKLGNAPAVEAVTDVVLLRRILGNMIKNALEATALRGQVNVWGEDAGQDVVLSVQNAGTVSDGVRHQIFMRSFSTKGDGRGIGTYSIKLLGEKYLHGTVTFASTAEQGTTFSIRVPKRWPARAPG